MYTKKLRSSTNNSNKVNKYKLVPTIGNKLSNVQLDSLEQISWPEGNIPPDDDPDLFDETCDPKKPVVVPFEEITAASYRIQDSIQRTPCNEQQKRGVIAASAGNHAMALAYHGRRYGIPVVVLMPISAPIMKINNCQLFGAKVIVQGENLKESKSIALKMSKKFKLVYINGYDNHHIIAGQGTMALEVLEQVHDLDAIVIPTGGGGLLAGVAKVMKTLKPEVQVIGVESEKCTGFAVSLEANKQVMVPVKPTLADGLSVAMVGVNALATARGNVDKMIAVSEDHIAISILRLIEWEKAVCEGSAAVGIAAIMGGQLDYLLGKKVVIVLTGGNIDTTILGRCIERGLSADQRLFTFSVILPDHPGNFKTLACLLADQGVSIKDIFHERSYSEADVFSVRVKCVCETRNSQHTIKVMELLTENYNKVQYYVAAAVNSITPQLLNNLCEKKNESSPISDKQYRALSKIDPDFVYEPK